MNLLFPAGLLLSALAVPIVALYFLKLRRKRVVVPSLMLWTALQKQDQRATPFDRFRRHILLLLQLLALAFLVFALARPVVETEANAFRSVVLVVDTSASMGATDGDPTRLDTARDKARAILDTLGPSDEAMVLTAGPRTAVQVPFTRDVGEVRAALDRVRGTEAEGSLKDGLQLAFSLARSRPDVEVVVLSDGGNEDLSSLRVEGIEVTYVKVGKASANTGILALDLRRSPVSELDRELFVTVQNFGDEPVDGTVEVHLGSELVGLRNERLTPGEPVSMVFPVDGTRRGLLRARVDVPGDVLPADDEAYAPLGKVSARRVVLVGGDALTARALKADPRVDLTLLPPTAVTPEKLAGADAVFVLEGPVSADLTGLNVAYFTRRVPGPAELGDLAPMPGITSWERTHPVLRFVDFQGATVARSASVGDLGGLVPIVDGGAGPVLLAGERDGGRVLQATFDPYETDLPMRVAWPVLLLNSVGWLTERLSGGSEAALLPAGLPYVRTLPGVDEVSVDGPSGAVDADLVDGVLRITDTDRIGLYQVRAGETSFAFATNLLSSRESSIRPARALALDAGGPVDAVASVRPGRRELWRPLLAFALLFLLLEWWAWNRRKSA